MDPRTDHDVSERDLVNVAPLQLGKEIVHSDPTPYDAGSSQNGQDIARWYACSALISEAR